MQVRVGDIAASCPACGASEFSASGAPQELSCQRCGKLMQHDALLEQIGEKAARAAAESLARLRYARMRRPS